MKSFSILRTNVGLTTNVKLIVDSNYNLYLESIDSVPQLSDSSYKKYQFTPDNQLSEILPDFYDGLQPGVAFSIKYDNDNDIMGTDFSTQYDDIYQMGAKNIIDNKNYTEEYEFFAPLYIFKQNMPQYFVIFRIDGPGLNLIESNNFRDLYLSNLKCVKIIDLTQATPIGQWIYNNITNNINFPVSSLNVNFNPLEFTRWYGIDYVNGGYTYKSQFIDETLQNENTLYDLESYFFNGWSSNQIVFPQIINFDFLFDDTPATPTSLRPWSINQYSGFYLNSLDQIDAISPFVTPALQPDVIIQSGNLISSVSFVDPFLNGFNYNQDMWVEYLGNFYKVKENDIIEPEKSYQPITTQSGGEIVIEDVYTNIIYKQYVIITDLDLTGQQAFLNQRTGCSIDNLNRIITSTGSAYITSGFLGDINLIEINGIYHNIVLTDGYLTLVTDYGFTYSYNSQFQYYTNSPDPNYNTNINLFITYQNVPSNFRIYRLNFTDIKDFDTQIIDSVYSQYEYEQGSSITNTEESKMYLTNLGSSTIPLSFDDFIYNGLVSLIPVASDYTAKLETFRINENDGSGTNSLSDIWRKNSIYCRFGYQNSLSTSDYPYLLNNNIIHENYNRTCDTQQIIPSRSSRNLDYFYTINSGTTSYQFHSLHVEKNYGEIQDSSFFFNIGEYLNLSTYSIGTISVTYSSDYFNYFFSQTQSFLGGQIVSNSQKYSYFESGDSGSPNMTVFRGIKFKLFEVSSIVVDNGSISSLNFNNGNEFEDYKFSMLLSSNFQEFYQGELSNVVDWGNFQYNMIGPSGSTLYVTSTTQAPTNIMPGDIIEIQQFYPFTYSYTGISQVISVGSFSTGFGFTTDQPFVGTSQSNQNPGYYDVNFQWSIIDNWAYDVTYSVGDLVIYYDVIYLVGNTNSISDPNSNPALDTNDYNIYTSNYSIFWNPNLTYSVGDFVYRQDDFYYNTGLTYGSDFWNTTSIYSVGEYVLYNGRYYECVLEQTIPVVPQQQMRSNDISINFQQYWVEAPNFGTVVIPNTYPIWVAIPIWNPNVSYYQTQGQPAATFLFDYVVYDNVLYQWSNANSASTLSDIPGISTNWSIIYSFVSNSTQIYTPTSNAIIQISNTYYICDFNRNLTLSNGITIYINEIYQNILINININDNTTANLDNTERDDLYIESNSRLTAANIINQINNIDQLYGFTDYVRYVIINEDGINEYDINNNLSNLPYFIICEEADNFQLTNGTLIYTPNTLDPSVIKPSFQLADGTITNIQQLNYYNDIPLGATINKNANTSISQPINYNGLVNISVSKNPATPPNTNSQLTQNFYRHSGNYMPVFYDIQLFQGAGEFDTLFGNYYFDDTLTLFGVMKQRIISKINISGSVLKLRNNPSQMSMYPMLDEFGYTTIDFFIFKSTWDFGYCVECNAPIISLVPVVTPILTPIYYTQAIIQKSTVSIQ